VTEFMTCCDGLTDPECTEGSENGRITNCTYWSKM